MDSMSSSSGEDEEEEEGYNVEVVWVKSAHGFRGLGHVFDGKLGSCMSLVIYVKKSGSLRIWYLQRSRWQPLRQEQRLPPSQEQS